MAQSLKDIKSKAVSIIKADGNTRIITGSFSIASKVISTLPVGHEIVVNDRVSYTVSTVAALTENGLVGVTNANSLETGTGVLRVDKTLSAFASEAAVQAAFPSGTLISFQADILSGATVLVKNSPAVGNVPAIDGVAVGDPGYWWIIFDLNTTTGFPSIANYPSFTSLASIDIYVGVTGTTNYNDLVVSSVTSTTITVLNDVLNASFTDLTVKKHSRIISSTVIDETDIAVLRVAGSTISKGLQIPWTLDINSLTSIYFGYNTVGTLISSDTPFGLEVAASDALFSSITIYDVLTHPLYSNIGVICYFDSGDSKNYIRTFTYEYNVGYTFNTAFEIVGSDTSTIGDICSVFSGSYTISNNLDSTRLVVLGGKSGAGTSIYAGVYTIDNVGVITQVNAWTDTGLTTTNTFNGIVKAQDCKKISSGSNGYCFTVLYNTDQSVFTFDVANTLTQIDSYAQVSVSEAYTDLIGQDSSVLAITYTDTVKLSSGTGATIPSNAYATAERFYSGSDRSKISLYHIDVFKGFGKSEFVYDGINGNITPLLNTDYFVFPENFQSSASKNINLVFELDNCIVFYKSLGYAIILDKVTGNLIGYQRIGGNGYTKANSYRTSCLINGNVMLLDLGNTPIANRIYNYGPFLATSKNAAGDALIPKSGESITTPYNLIKGKEYGMTLKYNGTVSFAELDTRKDYMFKKFGLAVDTNLFLVY